MIEIIVAIVAVAGIASLLPIFVWLERRYEERDKRSAERWERAHE